MEQWTFSQKPVLPKSTRRTEPKSLGQAPKRQTRFGYVQRSSYIIRHCTLHHMPHNPHQSMSLPGRPVRPCGRTAPPTPCVTQAARCGPPHGRGRVVTRWSHHDARAAFSHLVGLTWGRRPPPLPHYAHVTLVPSRREGALRSEASRRACSMPVSPGRFSTAFRCFSKG